MTRKIYTIEQRRDWDAMHPTYYWYVIETSKKEFGRFDNEADACEVKKAMERA